MLQKGRLSAVASKHRIQREGDEYACSCGLRWGLDDIDPHGLTFGRNDAIAKAPQETDDQLKKRVKDQYKIQPAPNAAGSPREIIEQLKKDLAG